MATGRSESKVRPLGLIESGRRCASVRSLLACMSCTRATTRHMFELDICGLARLGMSLSLWNWSRQDEDENPRVKVSAVYLCQYGAWATDLLQDMSSERDKEHPETIQAPEEAYLREWAIARGKATPDGLMLNEAAYRAYAR